MTPIARRSRSLIILCGVLLILGGGIFFFGSRLLSGSGEPPPEEPVLRAPVKWMEARQFFPGEWTEAVGTTQPLPERAARVTAPVEGHVVSVLQGSKGKLVEGQMVNKGDIIVQLDARLAKAHYDKALAALSELKPLIKQAEHAVKVAGLDLKRLTDLSPNSPNDAKFPLVSHFEMEKAKVALEEAESKLNAVGLHEITAQKELDILKEQLHLYTLVAPIDGRLGRLMVMQGQTITPGTHVADIVNVDEQIDVLCFVPPHVAKRLKESLKEHGKLAARLGGVDEQLQGAVAIAEGKVEFIADQAEVDTGNVAVKIRFPNNEMGLRTNTTLRVRVLTHPGKACLTLPDFAIFEDQDPPSVIVVENHKVITKEGKEIEIGTARKLHVKLGIRDRVLHVVEIISVHDPENKWQGKLDDAKFVTERGRGLRTDDPITLQVDED